MVRTLVPMSRSNTTAMPGPESQALLPKVGAKPLVPPIKCQGIKTKLVPFILGSVAWSGEGRWVEPFLGSGVVAFSLSPQKALLADTNPHVIGLYRAIQSGEIDSRVTRTYLEEQGARLLRDGSYYYEVRQRFNTEGRPLDFLFLNRSCFNGLIRFNRKGGFNVPFNQKHNRFRPAYITKIVNQVARLRAIMRNRDWTFEVADWQATVGATRQGDFIYADPPYIARFTDYFNGWEDTESDRLLKSLIESGVGFALSTWSHNRHRKNELLERVPENCRVLTTTHFYHLGATESLRNEMEEALILHRGCVKGQPEGAERGNGA